MGMHYRRALIIATLFFGFMAFFSQYIILSEENSRECGVVMLNEFGSQISSDFESLTASKYSEDFQNSSKVELANNIYTLTWVKKTKLGEIEHIVHVERFRLCPILFGDINVVIPAASSEVFEKYVRLISE